MCPFQASFIVAMHFILSSNEMKLEMFSLMTFKWTILYISLFITKHYNTYQKDT